MSAIKELVHTKHLTMPQPITPYLHSSKLIQEYYTIEYVSGVKYIYTEYINLPKAAKKLLRGCGLSHERISHDLITMHDFIIRDTVYRNY